MLTKFVEECVNGNKEGYNQLNMAVKCSAFLNPTVNIEGQTTVMNTNVNIYFCILLGAVY